MPVAIIQDERERTFILIGGRKLSRRFYADPIENLRPHFLPGLRAIEPFYADLLAVMILKNYRALCYSRGLGGLKADWQVYFDTYEFSQPFESVKKISRFESWLRAINGVERKRASLAAKITG